MRPTALLVLLGFTGCTPDAAYDTQLQAETESSLGEHYQASSRRHEVPLEVLHAISYTETGMQSIQGQVEFEGKPPVSGIMALREDIADDAADLARVDRTLARTHLAENIDAAAAWLSAEADAQTIQRANLGAWASVIVAYSGIQNDQAASTYVWDGVYAAIADGVRFEGGEIIAQHVEPDYPPPRAASSSADRSYAIWRPSPNVSSRPSGSSGDPSMVIIHTCEGSYSGCWGWLRNPQAGASAHYVVNSTGSEVSQLVRESDKAWHIGARYDCSLNSSTDCWRNGSSSNNFTIGIEHAGYGNQSSWNPGLLDQSAELVCDITNDHGIPRDRYHIVGHGQLQPYNRTDPGPNWPWTAYVEDVRRKCGDTSTTSSNGGSTSPAPSASGGQLIIDSNNNANVPNTAYVEVSSSWTSSANVRGYYNTGYFWRRAGAASDPANFHFNLTDATCYTVDAWWSAASDRSWATPFLMTNSLGTQIGSVAVDQRYNGGRWNELGTYQFTEGWNAVSLSRWTAGGIVVADAVRLRPSTNCSSSGVGSIPSAQPGAQPWEVVIDSNNAQNDSTAAEFEAGGDWSLSNSTPGFYGVDYAWRETGSSSDLASFWFYADDAANVSIEARWTAGSNRSTSAPFLMFDADERHLGTVTVDQTQHHASWVALGDVQITPGWNRVALSRWTQAGAVVVADAVRVTELP